MFESFSCLSVRLWIMSMRVWCLLWCHFVHVVCFGHTHALIYGIYVHMCTCLRAMFCVAFHLA